MLLIGAMVTLILGAIILMILSVIALGIVHVARKVPRGIDRITRRFRTNEGMKA